MEAIKSGLKAVDALKWRSWADNDYLAARKLFRGGLLVQASSLANTSIEKYLKSVFILFDIPVPRGYQGHDIRSLYSEVASRVPRLKLNQEFLETLFKAYALRYPDDLEVGYNIHLCCEKLLLELDYSVYEIRKRFEIKKQDESSVVSLLDSLLQNNTDEILGDNCYFGTSSREDFFKKPMRIYEIRVTADNAFIECWYESIDILDDGKFSLEALRPGMN